MMTSKTRTILAGIILLLAAASFVSASEVAAVWTRLYGRARTLDQKYQIMLNIVEQDGRDMIPILIDALDEQVTSFENPRSSSEKQEQIRLIKMVVKELGNLKARDAADLVWQVLQSSDDVILRGEAILALGKMGTRAYGEEMALMLRNLNYAGGEVDTQRENEILAYSLVKAFERIKHEAGLEHVFFASDGWYSSRRGVKEAAKKALQAMTDDPSDMLKQVIMTNDNYKWKLAALEAEERSSAPDRRKAELAAEALEEGIRLDWKNLVEKRQLKSLRVTALRMLAGYPKPESSTLISNMERMLIDYRRERSYEEDEVLTLLETMATFKTDEMGEIVSEFLKYLNERREFGPVSSLRIASRTIQTLGEIGSIQGIEELTLVKLSQYWERAIRVQADAALKTIQAGN
jgi:hypothetical protein